MICPDNQQQKCLNRGETDRDVNQRIFSDKQCSNYFLSFIFIIIWTWNVISELLAFLKSSSFSIQRKSSRIEQIVLIDLASLKFSDFVQNLMYKNWIMGTVFAIIAEHHRNDQLLQKHHSNLRWKNSMLFMYTALFLFLFLETSFVPNKCFRSFPYMYICTWYISPYIYVYMYVLQ